MFFSLVAEYDDELGSRLIIILCCFSLDAEDDNKPPNSLSFSTFFSSIVKDDGKPFDSLSSLGFLLQLQTMMTSQDPNSSLSLVVLQKMTMSFLVRCHFFIYFSLVVENDDKSGGSSSSLGFFFKCKRWQRVGILTYCHPWLFCFSCKKQQWARKVVVIFYIFFFRCKKQQWTRKLIIISWFFSSCAEDDDEPWSWLVVVLGCFASVVKDDNEPLGSLSFSTFFLFKCRRRWQAEKLIIIFWVFSQVQKMTTSRKVHCHFLVFFFKCKKQWQAKILAHHHCWLFCLSCERRQWALLACFHFLHFFKV